MAEEDNTQKGDKREAILQAALELIAEHGLQHTPMSLISKRARASAGIIYHYFESKDDLLESLYLRVKGDMGRAWLAADDPQQPLARRFQSLLLVIFRYCIAHPQEVAFLEQYESFPQAKPHDVQLQEKAKTLDSLIEDLRTQDLLKDLPLEVIGEFTLGMALRLARLSAAGVVSLDEATLTGVARACWDAIAR
jgi:AcrR family transcriptional regulator